jgi:hypothetical protein
MTTTTATRIAAAEAELLMLADREQSHLEAAERLAAAGYTGQAADYRRWARETADEMAALRIRGIA